MNPESTQDKSTRVVRRLIWLYFILLIIEGALRKWVAPQFSNPLLVIRDPVLLAIYAFAIPARVFPKNAWTIALAVMGILSLLITFVQLLPYLPPIVVALVSLFGFRSNFLHLPLIFVMARVLRVEDVKRFGWWTLVLLVPITALMVAQFQAPPDHFLNRTAGGEGEMMMSSLGKVRTAGPFSFVIGVVAYFGMATGFLVWAVLRNDVYQKRILAAAGAALIIGIAVSGSRSVVAACFMVVACLGIVFFIRPQAMTRTAQTLIALGLLAFVVSRTPIFKEGANVLATRFSEAAEGTDRSIARGMIDRVYSGFEEGLFVLGKAPILGYGLGIGTNAAARFLTGRRLFLLSEGEWPRIFLESGPILGLAFVLWRCAFSVHVGLLCLRSVRQGNLFPLLLFSSSFFSLINGQFGQPTILGFTVFTTGLALAGRHDDEAQAEAGAAAALPAKRPIRGRSAYSERLHGSSGSNHQSNGAHR